jgi:hypothetical protein
MARKSVRNHNQISTATSPGKIVSVDQKQPTVPGMIGQIKGIAARQRYHFIPVLVDKFSSMSFVHLQMTPSGEETLDTKIGLEGLACSRNVQAQHPHANKSRFCKNQWMKNIKKERWRKAISVQL